MPDWNIFPSIFFHIASSAQVRIGFVCFFFFLIFLICRRGNLVFIATDRNRVPRDFQNRTSGRQRYERKKTIPDGMFFFFLYSPTPRRPDECGIHRVTICRGVTLVFITTMRLPCDSRTALANSESPSPGTGLGHSRDSPPHSPTNRARRARFSKSTNRAPALREKNKPIPDGIFVSNFHRRVASTLSCGTWSLQFPT